MSRIEDIIKKALSTTRRSITGRQKGGVITRMEVSTGATCVAKIDPSVPTACWSFDGRHQIRIGTKLADICTTECYGSDAKFKKFVECVIRHETEHGICTDRSSTTVDKLKAEGLPFALYNLFEDARIEHASATRADGDGAFRWCNYVDIPVESNTASSIYWAIKSNEAGIKKSASAYVPKWLGTPKVEYNGRMRPTHLVILDFYRRSIRAISSESLLPIVKEWVKIFGADVETIYRDDVVHGESDPSVKGIHETEVIDSAKREDIKHSEEKDAAKWLHTSYPNQSLINQIVRNLRSIVVKAAPAKTRLATTGNKLHMASAIQGSERSFLNRSRKNGRRSVTMIVDMSGSMSKMWRMHGGREFVCAFKKLADQNLIKLDMILSQGKYNGKGDMVPLSHKVDGSQSTQWIGSLYPNGDGECLMGAMHRFRSSMKRTTTTVVFTDSLLSDDDINTSKYRNMGINAIAANIEHRDHEVEYARGRMDQHFARSVVSNNATELASKLIREILKD